MEKVENKKNGKGILNCVVATISIIAFFAAAFILGAVIFARIGGKSPTVFGYSFNLVITDSMEPEIMVDDLVIAKAVDKSEIEIGDDIVFVSTAPTFNGIQFVHRVVAIREDGGFVTSGIKACAMVDEYPVYDVIGKKVAVAPILGRIMRFFCDNQYIVLGVIVMIVLAVVVAEIVKMYLYRQEKGKN